MVTFLPHEAKRRLQQLSDIDGKCNPLTYPLFFLRKLASVVLRFGRFLQSNTLQLNDS